MWVLKYKGETVFTGSRIDVLVEVARRELIVRSSSRSRRLHPHYKIVEEETNLDANSGIQLPNAEHPTIEADVSPEEGQLTRALGKAGT